MNSSSSSGGIGLFGMIFIVFLTLKLAGIGPVATWSWWWVAAPLWCGTALIIVLGLISLIGFLLVSKFG